MKKRTKKKKESKDVKKAKKKQNDFIKYPHLESFERLSICFKHSSERLESPEELEARIKGDKMRKRIKIFISSKKRLFSIKKWLLR